MHNDVIPHARTTQSQRYWHNVIGIQHLSLSESKRTIKIRDYNNLNNQNHNQGWPATPAL